MRSHFALSGEKPEWRLLVGTEDQEISVPELAALNVEKREFQKKYMEYWNSTAQLTGTDRPVDAVISPLSVEAAGIPGALNFESGFSGIINVLDYTSIIIPVTHADKILDAPLSADKYLGERDAKSQAQCELNGKWTVVII